MLCDVCKKNQATVHFTQIVNGVKKECNLCESCAKENSGFDMIQDMNSDEGIFFQNILNGIIDYINQSPAINTKEEELVCKNCNTTFNEFKKNGYFGCSDCYENFNELLDPIIKRVQGSNEHIGKIPKKSGKNLIEKKKLTKLKEELQKVISLEEYEKAAVIRDKIKFLQEKGGQEKDEKLDK